VILVVQKVKCRLGVLFGREGDGQAGLYQRQAKQFALAWAVVDEEDGVMRHHYKERYQQGLCRERARGIDGYISMQKHILMQIISFDR